MLKSLLLVVWMVGPGMRLNNALPLPWFSGLAALLNLVDTAASWPQGLLDVYMAMISKADVSYLSFIGSGLSLRLGRLPGWFWRV